MTEAEPTDVAFQTLDEGAYTDVYSDTYQADTYETSDGDTVTDVDVQSGPATDVTVTSGPSTSVEVQH